MACSLQPKPVSGGWYCVNPGKCTPTAGHQLWTVPDIAVSMADWAQLSPLFAGLGLLCLLNWFGWGCGSSETETSL
ncbi:hypothetical protein ACOMHN_058006 [Nucella lapillus]